MPDNFFGENITNVTAIVGQNGSGKSNLVKAINLIFGDFFMKIESSKEPDSSGIQFIMVLDIHKKKKFYHSYDKIIFDGKNVFKYKKNSKSEKFSSIFFSNVFDGKKEHFISNTVHDISTNYLLSRISRDSDRVGYYVQTEFKRQINFIVSFKNKDVEHSFLFQFPKRFSIRLREYSKHGWFPASSKFNAEIKNKIEEIFYNTSSSHDFRGLIGIVILSFFMNNSLIYKEHIKEVTDFFNDFDSEKQKKGTVNFLEVVKKFLLSSDWISNKELDTQKKESAFESENNFGYPIRKKSLNALIKFIENCQAIDKYLLKKEIKLDRGIRASIIFPCSSISDENLKTISKFFNSYANVFIIPERERKRLDPLDPIKYEWEGMSSGELAMLNIFSRFYSLVDLPKKNTPLENNLILFIDEGELYLHADWQKKFLKSLLSGLQEIFKGHKLQIILTSHTPFVLSDIPKENIIFLNKDEKGNCLVVNGLSKEKTFAANIHTLLSDSFFLEGGLIGEFASGKIKEIQIFYKEVKEIEKSILEERTFENSKENVLSEKKKEYESKNDAFWKIQRMIGEEYLAAIVKNHLVEIETILFGIDAANEGKIDRLRKELKALEEEKGKKLK